MLHGPDLAGFGPEAAQALIKSGGENGTVCQVGVVGDGEPEGRHNNFAHIVNAFCWQAFSKKPGGLYELWDHGWPQIGDFLGKSPHRQAIALRWAFWTLPGL